ncbi:YqiA/YcfP family alpha/beta fold hydrolase [Achromobacter spanius]|uniref:Uncharacterized protein n=1 Tax=Achromobacter spanius TaxID=217203 RepID=A0A2S0I7N7_9BURK|nr:YqiA/YcfP family alpha/beta fold hydrolase [Achromobacter spanius]AVJ28003.1 hypothetical protein CLM73_13235 [Achromobacter spanius]
MIPLASFLHRIFPYGAYDDNAELIVKRKLFKPRNDCEPFFLKCPVNWEASDRLEDRNWRMQLQGWTYFHAVMNMFDQFGDKEELVRIFFELSRDWYSVYGEDPEDIKTSRMPDSYAWYDMSVGFRALVIAFFIDRISFYKISVPEADLAFLQIVGQKHLRHLSQEKIFSLNNHGIFQIQGLVALVQLLDKVDRKDEILSYGIRKMEELVRSQFGENGIHLEHSPHYHFYVCSTFEAVIQAGWYKDSEIISARISKALERKRWLVDPLTRPICVGDSILTPQQTATFLLQPHDNHNDEVVISDFHDSGYAVVRSPWKEKSDVASMLFLTAAYHSKSHKHRDCMSFDWFDRGDRIVCDGGKYGYKSDKYRNYFLSARAHNSVEIENFDIIKIKPYGSAVRDIKKVAKNVYCLSASLEYPAIKHSRQIYFCPGRWVAVYDDLAFQRARKFTQWFHLAAGFDVKSISGNKVVAADKNRSVIIQCLDNDLEVSGYHGDDVDINGFVSEKDYKFDPAWAIGFSAVDKQRSIVTTLALGEKEHIEVQDFVSNGFSFSADVCAEGSDAGTNGLETFVSRGVDDRSIPDDKKAASRMLKGVPHFTIDEDSFELKVGPATYTIERNGLKFHFYANISRAHDLTVLLPGAINREKGLVDFQRHSWAKELGTNVISFSDPTILHENDISIGWFQGNENAFAIDLLAELIDSLLKENRFDPSRMTVLGSSAGGFVALKLASRFPDARFVAINPQIFLFNYVQSHYERMMLACYRRQSLAESATRYRDRIVVEVPSAHRSGRIFIIQNTMDERHYELHLKLFLKQLNKNDYYVVNIESAKRSEVKSLNVLLYEDHLLGHSPPNKETTLRYLAIIDSL